MEQVTLSLEQLEPGLVLDQDIFSGTNILLKSGTQVTADLLIRLRQRNIESITVSSGSRLARILAPPPLPEPGEPLSREELFRRHQVQSAIPEQMLAEATAEVEQCFTNLEAGGELKIEPLRETVSGLVRQMLSNPSGAPKLFELKEFDAYTYRHSINVGLLLLLVAKEWGLPEERLEDITLAGVLHDVGKIRVGHAIINKEGPLNDEEWAIMRKHPVWSAEMVAGVELPPEALGIIRSHHERLDGRGYPDGLVAGGLNDYVRLSGICDVYDALTSRRSYKGKMDYSAAVNILLESSGTHFDSQILNQFVRLIGLYPVGTQVRLNTGETAVVLRINKAQVTRPVVSRVMSPHGVLYEHNEELDLSVEPRIFITGAAL